MSDTLTKIREKYPAYANTPDDKLVEAIGRKYPQYLQADQGFKDEFDTVTMSGEREALAASEKQADLLIEKTKAARSGKYWEGVEQRADALIKYVVEPSSRPASGTFGRAVDAVIPGPPVVEPTIQQSGIHLPKVTTGFPSDNPLVETGYDIGAGTYNAVADLVSALSSPDMVLQFPAAANRLVLTTWVSQMAGHQPERAIRAAELFKEGKTKEAVQEVATGVGEVTMAGLGTRHLIKTLPEAVGQPAIIAPRTVEAVKQAGEVLKTDAPAAIEIVPDQATMTASQRVSAASAKVRSNAADALGSVKETLAGIRTQLETARAQPADVAAQTLEAGRAAPAQAAAAAMKRAQDALDRADDIFGLMEDPATGASVKPADMASALDALADALKVPVQPQEPSTPKEVIPSEVQQATTAATAKVEATSTTDTRPGSERNVQGSETAEAPGSTAGLEGGVKPETQIQKEGQVLLEPKPAVAPAAAEPSFADAIKAYQETPTAELASYKGSVVGGATGRSWDLGAKARTPEDVAALRAMAEESSKKVNEMMEKAKASKDENEFNRLMIEVGQLAGRQPAEAYEFATGVTLDGKPKWDMFEKRSPGYKPPVPDAKYLEANGGPAAAPPAAPAPETSPSQRIGIIPEGAELTMNTVGNPNWWRRNFTASKGLPEGVPEAWLKRMGEVRAETRGATYAARDLATALRGQFNIGTRKYALRGLSDVPKPVMESIQRVLTGEADINTLAEPLREPVRKIREHVDALSQEMMNVLGPDNPMTATIGENLGVYLTRSYRIFDDPKWVRKIPVDIRNRAEAFLSDAGFTPEQARIRLNEMLSDWSDQGLDRLMRQGKLGAKDISIFMQRKDIAPEIRAVMGEYGDPITNYIRSITKMSRWMGDQEFLNRVKDLGMNRWLFEEGQARPPGFDSKLAADSSQTMYPLNGLRTSPEIKTIFETMDKSRPSDNFFARSYFAVNAWSRQAKTVFSALTQARNFIGNPFFNMKSGHINFTDYGPAFKAQWADIVGSDKASQAFYKEMARYGLVDENVVVSDLRASMKDAGLRDPSFEDYSMRGAARALRLAIEAPQRAYRLPDEMGKTVGWLAEQADLRGAHPEWTDVQVKETAAARVRNEYPTYSMIPEWLQQFRKQPFVGPFVNFAYETMRTSYWTLRNGSTDLFSEGNTRQKANGAKKLAGFGLTVGASGAILNEIGQMAFGIPDDTEDDVRRFLPFYSRNAQLVPLGKDGTKLRYLNYSYVNPYSVFNDAWVAAIQNNEKGIMDASMASFGELIRPFSNEQMLFGAIEQSIRNQDAFGNQIYNPLDEPEVKMSKAALHMSKAVLPGTLERFQKRILPSLTGEKTKSGQELNPIVEIASEFTGLRTDETDMLKQFSFKMREFQENEDVNARRLATYVLFNPNKPTFENALAAYRSGDDARYQIWQELYKDVNALLRQGATVDQIEDSLKAGKMSKKDIGSVLAGEYTPLSITDKDYRNVNIESDEKILDAIQDEYDQRLGKKL